MPIPFPHIEARGSYRELGRAVGEGAREQIAAAVAFYQEHFRAMAGIDFAEAERQALTYLPYAQKHLPEYVEELAGMAEGARQPFVKLLVPNCAEEFTCPTDDERTAGADRRPRPPGPAHFCTAVAVSAGDRHLVGHNMDWYVVDVDKNVLFDLTTPSGTRIVTIAGVPYLPILGMNSHGVAYVGNSVYCNDGRPGVPNVFVRRWVLEASSLGEAAARAAMPARARGSNHLFGDRDGRIWDLETSARGAVLTEHQGSAAHTNHYVAPAMAVYEGPRHAESRTRLAEAQAALAAGLAAGEDPRAVVERVLRSHENAPDCVCGHPDDAVPVGERVMTVASMVCDLDTMELSACAGPPCENPYTTWPVSAA
jgi:isopenicillin-N N-acyltransferase like protein